MAEEFALELAGEAATTKHRATLKGLREEGERRRSQDPTGRSGGGGGGGGGGNGGGGGGCGGGGGSARNMMHVTGGAARSSPLPAVGSLELEAEADPDPDGEAFAAGKGGEGSPATRHGSGSPMHGLVGSDGSHAPSPPSNMSHGVVSTNGFDSGRKVKEEAVMI
jgi:hypothetical protein